MSEKSTEPLSPRLLLPVQELLPVLPQELLQVQV